LVARGAAARGGKINEEQPDGQDDSKQNYQEKWHQSDDYLTKNFVPDQRERFHVRSIPLPPTQGRWRLRNSRTTLRCMFIIGLGTAAPLHRYTQAECYAALQSSPQWTRLLPRSQAIIRKVFRGEN